MKFLILALFAGALLCAPLLGQECPQCQIGGQMFVMADFPTTASVPPAPVAAGPMAIPVGVPMATGCSGTMTYTYSVTASRSRPGLFARHRARRAARATGCGG